MSVADISNWSWHSLYAEPPQNPLQNLKKEKKSQLLSIKLISEIETYIQPQLKPLISQVPMIHTCNPSYSRGKDQEDCSLKPFLGK
jgi:hypothetical protein